MLLWKNYRHTPRRFVRLRDLTKHGEYSQGDVVGGWMELWLHDLVSSSHASYYCRAELDEGAPLHSLVGRPYAFFFAVLAAPQSEPGLTRSG
jgi:hypothetical protein